MDASIRCFSFIKIETTLTIMGVAMYNRLERFLNQSHIISEDQYNFRKKYSTYMALINLIDKLSSGTDSKTF